MPLIDLRTDVLTPPTAEMWDAMRHAEIGWTLYRQDRTVNELEEFGAELLGKEAGLFLPTCSIANLLALMTLGARGTQAVVAEDAHIVVSEEWGISRIAHLYPGLVKAERGVLSPETVEQAILNNPRIPPYQSRTSLVCLENSNNNAGGVALTVEQTSAVAQIAHRHDAAVYLDGARLFNSAAALAVPPHALVKQVDAVGVSLNKGLCAPYGALLCSSAAVIERARAKLKRIGAASIHKAGIFAAAALVALQTMRERLAEDHARAAALARGLAAVPGIRIDLATVQTNIVLADVSQLQLMSEEFAARLQTHGVLVYPRPHSRVRLVTHRMITDQHIAQAIAAVADVCQEHSQISNLKSAI